MQSASPAKPKPGAVFLRYWFPVLAYVGLIFSLSSLRSTGPTFFRWQDKVEHLMEYGLFGLLLVRALRHALAGRNALFVGFAAAVAGSLVGAADEIYQRSVPGRTSDVRDWAADTVAVLLAALITYLVLARAAGTRRADPVASPAAGGREGPER